VDVRCEVEGFEDCGLLALSIFSCRGQGGEEGMVVCAWWEEGGFTIMRGFVHQDFASRMSDTLYIFPRLAVDAVGCSCDIFFDVVGSIGAVES